MRNLTHAEASERAALITVSSYDVALDLTQGPEHFLSTTVVRFRSNPGSSFLELDVPELLEATLDGRPLSLTANRLVLAGLGGEHEARVVARAGYTRSGEGLHRFVDPADGRVYLYMHAFMDEAQRVFACFDQPDLKARFRLQVTAPVGNVVRSNTRAQVDGQLHVFAETGPLSTYLISLVAGPWHGAQQWQDGIEFGVWCRQSMAAHLQAPELLRTTAQSMAFQQERFGSRFPFGDSYDQVFCPEFNAGAMENPGMVTFSDEGFLFRSRTTTAAHRGRAAVIAHEMAHMWFGDLVTMRWWDGIWLNESFAEFMGMTTADEALEWKGSWVDFCLGRKAWGYRADQLPTTHPVHAQVPDSRAALLNFDGISYAKGASVLRQLAAFVGEDVFWEGLRDYLAEHANGSTDLKDLLRAVETSSGRDLQDWAQAWLRTPGVNTLRSLWEDGVLVVEQTGQPLREHVVGIGAYDDAGGRLVLRQSNRVELSGSRTVVPDIAPADLVLVNDGDLTFAKLRFDQRSLATALAGTGRLADPLARALCWGALWDAARDAELPARDLVRAVLAGIGTELDPSAVQTLLERALHAAGAYAPVAEQQGLLDDIAHWCWQAPSEPGSDLQLVRFRAAVSAGSDPDRLGRLLAGDVPAGVVLDTDLRWHVVARAAALGLLDEQAIEDERARDATASGQLQADGALAARPDAGSKARAWQALTGGGATNAQLRATGAGFWQRGQQALLRPYADAYVGFLPGLWAGSSVQLSQSATLHLFPATLVAPDVAALIDRLLAPADLPAGMRRIVLECADDLARCLRAQAAAR